MEQKQAIQSYEEECQLPDNLEKVPVEVDEDDVLVGQKQLIQWYDQECNYLHHQVDQQGNLRIDQQGNLLDQQANPIIDLPFLPEQAQVKITSYPAMVRTSPVKDPETGQFLGYVRVSESLEDLYDLQRKLDWGLGSGIVIALALSGVGGIWLTRQAMEPIEESFQRLKQFTADASHELRSPLMAIKSNAAVALKYPEGMRPTDTEKFEAIASGTKQMTRLTEGLLLLARTDKAKHLDRQNLNLALILSDLVRLYQTQAWEKQIDLKAQLTRDLCLLGDEMLLRQLFTNLIQNALYHTPSGGVVAIQTSCTRSHLIVKVQDTGVGIAPEHLEKIFERFWRVDQSRSYKAQKSGLGLAIAQAIAHRHGGLITVESQLGVGSCFTVSLPISPKAVKYTKAIKLG
ncbi:MAG: HAMP domain-containing histidine kinase [Moorea sp. SIO1G6]|nr:HAMP domain-containing histidine kinase [Moorena sp. SIO1G6]